MAKNVWKIKRERRGYEGHPLPTVPRYRGSKLEEASQDSGNGK
jgi:hypothetical protein